jgi:hypothetical protein
MNGHRPDTHFLAGPDDAAGNLAAVGNQNFANLAFHNEKRPSITDRRPCIGSAPAKTTAADCYLLMPKSGWPNSTG